MFDQNNGLVRWLRVLCASASKGHARHSKRVLEHQGKSRLEVTPLCPPRYPCHQQSYPVVANYFLLPWKNRAFSSSSLSSSSSLNRFVSSSLFSNDRSIDWRTTYRDDLRFDDFKRVQKIVGRILMIREGGVKRRQIGM